MLTELKYQIQSLIEKSLKEKFEVDESILTVELEVPSDKSHGEFSCNIALKSAKYFKNSPIKIANQIIETIQKEINESSLKNSICRVEVKNPGFINFYLTNAALYEILYQIRSEKNRYGSSNFGKDKRVQVEFVSANPTGPLSIAHARQAAVGDALANILEFIGFNVDREYYVNDEGNQIKLLGESVKIRACEILNDNFDSKGLFSDDHYKGEYIKDIAQSFVKDFKIKEKKDLEGKEDELERYSVDYLMNVIKKDLDDFNVRFDFWSHQSEIATIKNIEGMLKFLTEKDLVYEKDGAQWFRSSNYQDDKDRVLKKSDGSYTYLAPDIVYHKNKYDRGFEYLINIWGPDHHGYIERIKAAVEALGKDRSSIEVLIVQLATIYREGKKVSMSTRGGQYISLREVIDEVGVDAARFFFLMRHSNQHLDFDLDLAKKETPENPVYYIQYAHARIHSINTKAVEANIKIKHKNLSLLKEKEELDLIKKLGIYPDIMIFCYNKLDTYPLISHLQDIATSFHKFYDKHRVIDAEKEELSSERLALINATKEVLANGLRLLGLSTPEKM